MIMNDNIKNNIMNDNIKNNKKNKNSNNRSAMRFWGLILNFIPSGWNAVLRYQHLGDDLLQVKK